MAADGDASPFRYHLELTPEQLKITHTALRSLLDAFGHDEAQVHALIHEVLAKLPDEHAIRAIRLDTETKGAEELLRRAPEGDESEALRPAPGSDDEPPPTVA